MVSEVEAMYQQTREETGLSAMSPAVRAALGRVERHRLVPPDQADAAYANHPLPIGAGQTISQPYIVALSTDLLGLKGGETVLDVGTGSGYQAALLAEIAGTVCSIEAVEPLARGAREHLLKLGYRNIEIRAGDGYQGWPERAPFDAIVVTAATPQVPAALIEQLKPGGRMVIPLGESHAVQMLTLVKKTDDGMTKQRRVLPVRFVPLVPQ